MKLAPVLSCERINTLDIYVFTLYGTYCDVLQVREIWCETLIQD